MKEKIFAAVMIILIITAVTANTVFLGKDIDKIYSSVNSITILEDNCESAKAQAEKAFELFRSKELFVGLTVNHDDLSTIESCFSEMLGYLSVGDAKEATVAKNRLTDALGHLRRLSGFNIDAII